MNAMQVQPESLGRRHSPPRFRTIGGTPLRVYYAVIPDGMAPGAEPLVVVHGISRNAAELAVRFGELANQYGVPILAPLFERAAFGMYQQVVDPRRGIRADEALFDILADSARMFGTSDEHFSLFGFSGGAQFAHRCAILHPRRVRGCVAAAAGWYTMPDPDVEWPLGLGAAPVDVDHAALSRLPFHVLVGDRDREQDDALRRSPEIDAAQGAHRVQRARRWHRAMRARSSGSQGTLTVVPGLSHSFGDAARQGVVAMTLDLLGLCTPASGRNS